MDIEQNRLYGELAHLWPLVSAPEDYAEEASFWRKALREKLGPERHQVLELGCGGGNNLSHLTGDFQITAVDLSPGMLENSKRLNPTVEHHVGDMRTVRLGRKFAAVIIHDAITYMTTEADILATLETAKAHLEPGGIIITAPDYVDENFPGSFVSHDMSHGEDVEFVFVEYVYDTDPDDHQFETILIYMINHNGEIRIEHDKHVLGLFAISTWQRLYEKTGFRFETRDYPVHEDDRQGYLFVGTLR